jgi:hypothetical protein
MAKRPKRKVEVVQGVLFDVKEYTTGGTEVEVCDQVFNDVEEIYGPTSSTDVGLLTNEIYCGDTVETMKKIKDNVKYSVKYNR